MLPWRSGKYNILLYISKSVNLRIIPLSQHDPCMFSTVYILLNVFLLFSITTLMPEILPIRRKTHNLLVKQSSCFNFNCFVYFHSKVECKKSKACFAAKNHRAHSRDIPVGGHHDPHSRDVPVHREVHRGVVRRGRTFSLGGLINQFLRNLF